jgi:acyl-CoA thioesterase
MKSPEEIVMLMYDNDEFSSLLGVQINEVSKGSIQLSLKLQEKHTNGFKIAHGGICYSLADTCLAFVANTFGFKAVSVETSISHLVKVQIGDLLLAKSHLIHKGNSSAVFVVEIHNQENRLVAHFKGSVRISTDLW